MPHYLSVSFRRHVPAEVCRSGRCCERCVRRLTDSVCRSEQLSVRRPEPICRTVRRGSVPQVHLRAERRPAKRVPELCPETAAATDDRSNRSGAVYRRNVMHRRNSACCPNAVLRSNATHHGRVCRSARRQYRSFVVRCSRGRYCRDFRFSCYCPFQSPVFRFSVKNRICSYPKLSNSYLLGSYGLMQSYLKSFIISKGAPTRRLCPHGSPIFSLFHSVPAMRRSTELRATAVIGNSSSPSSSRPRTVISNDSSSVRSRCI